MLFRSIIEDILDIQVFSTMNVLLRDKVRENNEDIKTLDYEIYLVSEKIDLQKKYMLELEKKTKEEITRKENKIAELLGDEYNKIQGFLHVSEIAPGWVRKVNKLLIGGRKKWQKKKTVNVDMNMKMTNLCSLNMNQLN